MKIVILVSCLLISLPVAAEQQYSQFDCDNLKQEKENIRKSMNKGYSVGMGEWLKQRDRDILLLLSRHCDKPIQQVSPSNTPQTTFSSAPTTERLITRPSATQQSVPSVNHYWSDVNRSYTGEKLKAWQSYYQKPARCLHRQSSEDDFIYCANNKAEQRESFEAAWAAIKP